MIIIGEDTVKPISQHPSRFSKGETFRVRYAASGDWSYYLVTDDKQAVSLELHSHLVKLGAFGEKVMGEKVNLRLTVIPQ